MYIPNWGDDVLTGDPKIDKEHQELFEKIDAFVYAMTKNMDDAQIKGTLNYMKEYIEIHFKEEEQLHKDAGAPGFDDHVNAHKNLENELNDVMSMYQKEGVTAHLEMRILNGLIWDIVEQIHAHDLPLAQYIREKPHHNTP